MTTRRTILIGAAAALIAACERQTHHPAPARQTPGGAWEPPAGALDLPGFALWGSPEDAVAPLEARLLTLKGETTLRALMAGRPALLSFWAPWCAPCLAEKPSLDVLARRLAEAGDRLAVLSIMVMTHDEPQTAETAAEHQRRMNLKHLLAVADAAQSNSPFPAYIGGGGVTLPDGSAPAWSLPRSTLIDPNGRELGRLVNAQRRTAPPGFVSAPGEEPDPEEVATWPLVDLWRKEDMFAFLRALGS